MADADASDARRRGTLALIGTSFRDVDIQV
jgi:hypothetical protein